MWVLLCGGRGRVGPVQGRGGGRRRKGGKPACHPTAVKTPTESTLSPALAPAPITALPCAAQLTPARLRAPA